LCIIDFIRVSPTRGCHPAPFYLSDLICPLFFVNLPTFFSSFGCHSPRRVSPVAVPPSDATAVRYNSAVNHRSRYIRSQSASFTHTGGQLVKVLRITICDRSLPLPAHFWRVFAVPSHSGRSPRARDGDLVGGRPTSRR